MVFVVFYSFFILFGIVWVSSQWGHGFTMVWLSFFMFGLYIKAPSAYLLFYGKRVTNEEIIC